METPATQRALLAFERQNSFARAVLGLASMLARFDDLVRRTSVTPELHASSQPDQPLLYALLGCVALHRRLSEILASMPVPQAAAAPDAERARACPLR